ncbi:hypothetical protein ALC56_11159 [Trachymyrmex septentrionalis]|uniref:Uncharacterized protein n=1 Tax=Trachymyrmex septentrionalis TaxID=34720 RepID=A0A195F265_9HYME|nr:hypothetical protein ALC56_11159 [Trachymyrmex septentrionalis]
MRPTGAGIVIRAADACGRASGFHIHQHMARRNRSATRGGAFCDREKRYKGKESDGDSEGKKRERERERGREGGTEGVKRSPILAEGDLQEGGHNGLKRSLERAATAAAKYPRCRVPLAVTARTYLLRCDDVYALHRVTHRLSACLWKAATA